MNLIEELGGELITEVKNLIEELGGELITEVKNENLYGRCLYLLDELQITLPVFLAAKIPYADELKSSKSLWSPLVTSAYRKGKAYGKGDIEELKEVIFHLVATEMKTYDEYIKFVAFLNSLANGVFQTNVEIPISEVKGSEIEKFYSGFKPLDQVTKGLYQGVWTVAGLPGSGKTSILLSVAACFANQWPVCYYQTEIPSQLIQSRIGQLNPKQWHKESRLFVGNYSTSTILEYVLKNPDNDRIIIYDGPEIKNTAQDDLIYWEQTYQELVQIKLHCKSVFVTSQIKQNISWDDLGIYSLSGSANKARYSDGIIFIGRLGDNLLMKSSKNRFGTLGQTVSKFNYETLQLEDDVIGDLFNE